MSYSELLFKFGVVSFQEHVSKGITHPVFDGDLVYKLQVYNKEGQMRSEYLLVGLENNLTPSTLSV